MSDSSTVPNFVEINVAQPVADGTFERPLILLGDGVLLPTVITTIPLLSPRSRVAAQAAATAHESVLLMPVRLEEGQSPRELPLGIATESVIGRLITIGDETTILVQGRRRVEIIEYLQTEPHVIARARLVQSQTEVTRETTAMMQAVSNLFKRVTEVDDLIPEDVLFHVLNASDPGLLADLITSSLTISFDERLQMLTTLDADKRLHQVAILLGHELNMLELKDEIASQIQHEMDREQREVYLREQMRVIQSELGEDDFFQQELNDVREQISEAKLPREAHDKAMKELSRLAIMSPLAPEVGMVRSYIDWLTSVPWSKVSADQLDIAHAQRILDAEHYGLPKVKDRILEYIAVRKLAADRHASPILCFVGPPGVGKTSLGKSIASALGRTFVRVSLGGVRDEAEIRGHRRTYIGALPGRILQTMRRAGTINPVFMLDEIDKLGSDFRGDPSAALLEVLDPEQNHAFFDHYLDIPYDLSKVMFVTTANDLDPLPPALLDRLEIIELNGYTEEEKLEIARRFLIPRQTNAHGLEQMPLRFETSALQTIIREYTYEAGVRNLEREIANVTRKVARLIAEDKRHPQRITSAQVEKFLGPPPFDDIRANDKDEIGVATGLAWTPVGGDILLIEASVLPGKGNLTLTGSLGDVMQESAQAALSYMRSRAEDLEIPYEDFENLDIHIHLPEGAVPKEGPSAGITLAAAIVSAFTDRPVRSDIAMTGEITLRGKVLPVGGIKEKVLAAHRARIKHVILPKQNQKELVDIPKDTLATLTVTVVSDMQAVLDSVLLEGPPVGERRIDRLREDKDKADDEEGGDER
ncbi:MAG: endopeptidase La [Chloroflexota bacterium]|nr:endopeptidase La [Chloroflexota bacterium]